METIICSAIWYKELPLLKPDLSTAANPYNVDVGVVFCGWRHLNCMRTMGAVTGLRSVVNATDGVGEHEQGFLTNKNRFVDRTEGAKIAIASGQVKKLKFGPTELYSEDLY